MKWLIPAAAAAGLLVFGSTRFPSLLESLTGSAARSPADIGASFSDSLRKRDYIDFTRGGEEWVDVQLLVTPDGADTVIQGQGPDQQPPINFGAIRKIRVGKGAAVTVWASHPLWNDGKAHEAGLSFTSNASWPINIPGGVAQNLGLLEIESVNKSSINVTVEQSGKIVHRGTAALSNFLIQLPYGEYDVIVSLGAPGASAGSKSGIQSDTFNPPPCRVRITGGTYIPVTFGPGEPPFCPASN